MGKRSGLYTSDQKFRGTRLVWSYQSDAPGKVENKLLAVINQYVNWFTVYDMIYHIYDINRWLTAQLKHVKRVLILL